MRWIKRIIFVLLIFFGLYFFGNFRINDVNVRDYLRRLVPPQNFLVIKRGVGEVWDALYRKFSGTDEKEAAQTERLKTELFKKYGKIEDKLTESDQKKMQKLLEKDVEQGEKEKQESP